MTQSALIRFDIFALLQKPFWFGSVQRGSRTREAIRNDLNHTCAYFVTGPSLEVSIVSAAERSRLKSGPPGRTWEPEFAEPRGQRLILALKFCANLQTVIYDGARA